MGEAKLLPPGDDAIARHSDRATSAGARRAQARLAAKLDANRKLYAGVTEGPPSRQVKRRRDIKSAKGFAAKASRRRDWREFR